MKLADKRAKKYAEAVERNVGRFMKASNEELQNYATCSLNQAKVKLGIRKDDDTRNDEVEGKLKSLVPLDKGEPIADGDGE